MTFVKLSDLINIKVYLSITLHLMNDSNQYRTYCEVATSMIGRHKKPRHDLIVVLHSKSCDAAEKVVARLLKTRDHRGGDFDSTVRSCIA